MKITSIEIFDIDFNRKIAGGQSWNPVVMKINTDENISGFGEVGLAYGDASKAGVGILRDYARHLLGADPMKSELIWNKLLTSTFWGQGGGGVIFAGMSAIDIALWDIKGKALGVPVYQLLGGKSNEKLRAYASQLQFNWHTEEEEILYKASEYADVTRKAMDEGYDCIKVDPIMFDEEGIPHGWKNKGPLSQRLLKNACERIEAMRKVGGDGLDIIIEVHSFTDAMAAIQLGKALEPYNVFYYEEPVAPLNPKLMKKVKDNVNIPIASGERIYSRWGYRPFFEDRSLDVIQPDLCTCGGIGEGKKICDMAHVYDMHVQVHVCGGPISTAAALQVEAAIPNFLIHEQHSFALLDYNIKTCKYDYQPVNGYFDVPDLPGIGQELSEETMKAFPPIIIK
ncbi:mandelate racemase/muconate lactonizing enzyme family protein [Sporomusa acidovorans]|uniref:D-galactonate dehydratase n=1 Tax=Sporomusa acidovorans (strain ATCC 49682 / DSM 3132 / Mol) TaxID=1123286 RepID=A0ABZ3JAM8_SPOA4|nr:mandelate racemase/muconate lactonizing enzyme family protein [Sporomusa acidovorans]OZC13247.1 D-galactonate dehydratase [Sporomusa acidovorans DSM 3132]SDD99815.1 L-alanine-DL-glutamate epimerase [Sporomusa acidovorans]